MSAPRLSRHALRPQENCEPHKTRSTPHMLITLISFRRLASELSGSELDQVRRVDVRDSPFTLPLAGIRTPGSVNYSRSAGLIGCLFARSWRESPSAACGGGYSPRSAAPALVHL
ncbi:hypothetical protein FA13DRAFT_577514 [Coprinellus micaceus]|uniref:Uncharacterized protein n=1 Tax=Coprinellus micaceus TaxID=71717 RepID=A0A4Y7T7R6_COPMI|nr:hypothetical protein FA13DRAFT_577514 [Coprinellus micaceus]